MSGRPWHVRLIGKLFSFRFFFARLTRLPLIGKAADSLFFKGDSIIYLPRDIVVEVNRPIAPQDNMPLPSEVVEHFVGISKHRMIMNECICRSSAGCKDYPVDYGCLFLGEAVLRIDPALGRRVTAEEALDYLKKCRDAGLVHLIGKNKLDAVWLNAGPADKLLTICNCCPCCCLWKILPDLEGPIGSKVTKMPGLDIRVGDDCTGCGKCTRGACFVDAIKVVDGKAVIGDECRGCGRCADVCPAKAIEVRIDSDSLQRSIDQIAAVVDVA